MLYRILVATPTLGFGELIRQSLEDAGTFSVVITSGCETAVQLAEKEAYALAILDSDLDECLLTELAEKLRAATERQGEALRLLIVPPGENETAEYEALQVDGYISKPFYLPDLLEKVSRILGVEQPVTADPLEAEAPAPREQATGRKNGLGKNQVRTNPRPQIEAAPGWFQDPDQVRRVLEEGFSASMACGAFVLRFDQVWASVGLIPAETSQELGISLAQQWSTGSGTDLARFVHLEVCGGDCMLYATNLGDEFLLAIVFEAERPFSLIRKQANRLARRLRQPNAQPPDEGAQLSVSEEAGV